MRTGTKSPAPAATVVVKSPASAPKAAAQAPGRTAQAEAQVPGRTAQAEAQAPGRTAKADPQPPAAVTKATTKSRVAKATVQPTARAAEADAQPTSRAAKADAQPASRAAKAAVQAPPAAPRPSKTPRKATANKVAAKPPEVIRLAPVVELGGGQIWKMAGNNAVAYVRRSADACVILNAAPQHLAKRAMAVYRDKNGKPIAWQVRFETRRWEEIEGLLR